MAADLNIFIRGTLVTGLIITVYVDDIKVIGKELANINALKADLISEFQISDLGLISFYLGVKV